MKPIFILQLLNGTYIQCAAAFKEARGSRSYCIRRAGHPGKHKNILGRRF